MMFANSGKKAETVYSQRKVTWSLLPSEKVAAMRPDEASACLLLCLALWERWIGAKRQDGEGYHRLLTALSCCLQHKLFPEGEP